MSTTKTSLPKVHGSSFQSAKRTKLKRFFAGEGNGKEQTATNLIQDSSRPLVRVPEVKEFFSQIKCKVEPQQRYHDRKCASGFNVVKLFKPNENKLSDVLKWLLDPGESHGQSDLFLRLLFEHLKFDPAAQLTANAALQTQASTYPVLHDRRYMDVLVKAGAWLVIENKLDSPDQENQVKDYLEFLNRTKAAKYALIYLTLDGHKPTSLDALALKTHEQNKRLHCWSYQGRLRNWLEDCRKNCEAQTIKNFLADFLAYIELELKRESENQ